MELTITFFIKFTLIVYFVLVLFFKLFSLLHFNDKFDRYIILNFFSKGLHFSLLSYNYPIWRADYKRELFFGYKQIRTNFLQLVNFRKD